MNAGMVVHEKCFQVAFEIVFIDTIGIYSDIFRKNLKGLKIMNNVTHEECKRARNEIGFSILTVANKTGLNRNNIAAFERGRYLLDDTQKRALFMFYEAHGYEFDIDDHHIDSFSEYSSEAIAKAKVEAGADVARLVERILDDAAIRIDLLEDELQGLRQSPQEKPRVNSEFISDVLSHFEIDCKDGHGVEYGVFFGESAESRAATICAGLAAGLLSELSVLHPELFPKNPPQDSDLMILRD
ncbi:MAG: helix-turn-helix transcriptional regulator, partial [bacterium]|nr:helix-turn-helix transcriptional regulator [bacterium]